jgi:hypothetical protein
MSAPPGVDRDAGSDSTISGTVDGAVAAAVAHLAELESDTLTMGSSLGDALPMPGHVFSDTTELQGEPGGPNPNVPGVPLSMPHQGGSYTGNTSDNTGS